MLEEREKFLCDAVQVPLMMMMMNRVEFFNDFYRALLCSLKCVLIREDELHGCFV
jgi:hypothetical protein